MVDIVVACIVACDMLERIPGKAVTTVVIYCLECGSDEKQHALAGCQAGNFVSYACADGIEEKSFEWVVVKGSISVWHVESVMARVDCCGLLEQILRKWGNSSLL
jgi:hypothetical protein